MVTVAIPVLNGSRTLGAVLAAVRSQRLDRPVELLVCDSGSVDGSRELALSAGARLLEIPPASFTHGGTRNLMMEQARGEFVVFLTQDAEPLGESWLSHLLEGFEIGDEVALVYGPYVPRPGCPPREARRLERFFASLSPDGRPRVDRLSVSERRLPPSELFGRRTYFTDANGCVSRAAWQTIPFPHVPYAEDQALALAMLKAGFAKAFMPDAGVLHSHHLTPVRQLQRDFDDWRGLLEVYGWREPASAGHIVLQLRGAAGISYRELREDRVPPLRRAVPVAAAVLAQLLHLVGAILGSRADRIPAWLRRRLSLDGRDTCEPLELAPQISEPPVQRGEHPL